MKEERPHLDSGNWRLRDKNNANTNDLQLYYQYDLKDWEDAAKSFTPVFTTAIHKDHVHNHRTRHSTLGLTGGTRKTVGISAFAFKCVAAFLAVFLIVLAASLTIVLIYHYTDILVSVPADDSIIMTSSGQVVFNLSITMQRNFTENYLNSSSREYEELATTMVSTVDEIFRSSGLNSTYSGSVLVLFRPGSVISELMTYFSQTSNEDALSTITGKSSHTNAFLDEVNTILQSGITKPNCCNGLVIDSVILTMVDFEPLKTSPIASTVARTMSSTQRPMPSTQFTINSLSVTAATSRLPDMQSIHGSTDSNELSSTYENESATSTAATTVDQPNQSEMSNEAKVTTDVRSSSPLESSTRRTTTESPDVYLQTDSRASTQVNIQAQDDLTTQQEEITTQLPIISTTDKQSTFQSTKTTLHSWSSTELHDYTANHTSQKPHLPQSQTTSHASTESYSESLTVDFQTNQQEVSTAMESHREHTTWTTDEQTTRHELQTAAPSQQESSTQIDELPTASHTTEQTKTPTDPQTNQDKLQTTLSTQSETTTCTCTHGFSTLSTTHEQEQKHTPTESLSSTTGSHTTQEEISTQPQSELNELKTNPHTTQQEIQTDSLTSPTTESKKFATNYGTDQMLHMSTETSTSSQTDSRIPTSPGAETTSQMILTASPTNPITESEVFSTKDGTDQTLYLSIETSTSSQTDSRIPTSPGPETTNQMISTASPTTPTWDSSEQLSTETPTASQTDLQDLTTGVSETTKQRNISTESFRKGQTGSHATTSGLQSTQPGEIQTQPLTETQEQEQTTLSAKEVETTTSSTTEETLTETSKVTFNNLGCNSAGDIDLGLSDPVVHLFSPLYPSSVSGLTTDPCIWFVHAPAGVHIVIHIYSYDISGTLFFGIGTSFDVQIEVMHEGTHEPGHIALSYQHIWIYYSSHVMKGSEMGFHLGVQALRSEDFTNCEAYPYIVLNNEMCDRILQCPNGEDESSCECQPDEHKCENGVCVKPADTVCNGRVDCIDFSDDGASECFGNSTPDVLQVAGCGMFSGAVQQVTRIVSGAETLIRTWPAAVSYRYSSGDHGCGATLINSQWAITAAHCTGLDYIVLGATHLNVPPEYPHIRTVQFIKHPLYRGSNGNNDIALLKLSSAVDFSDDIQPACLQYDNDEFELYDKCYAVGWGSYYMGGPASPTLKEGAMPLVSLELCQAYQIKTRLFISSNQLCAGFHEGGNGTCHGDSGGPLFCLGANRQWRLVGVTSTGVICGGAQSPGVFTRIAKYIDFIRHTIATYGVNNT